MASMHGTNGRGSLSKGIVVQDGRTEKMHVETVRMAKGSARVLMHRARHCSCDTTAVVRIHAVRHQHTVCIDE
eukprot:2859138-Pyramimonas_sp.AAC.1